MTSDDDSPMPAGVSTGGGTDHGTQPRTGRSGLLVLADAERLRAWAEGRTAAAEILDENWWPSAPEVGELLDVLATDGAPLARAAWVAPRINAVVVTVSARGVIFSAELVDGERISTPPQIDDDFRPCHTPNSYDRAVAALRHVAQLLNAADAHHEAQ